MVNIPEAIIEKLKSDNCIKNYRIVSGDLQITNNNIVEGSVSFTESVCSGNALAFGAGERSVFEAELFETENLLNKNITVYIEILCSSSIVGSVNREDIGSYVYPILLGNFVVESSKRKNGDARFQSITAYGTRDKININERISKYINLALKYGIDYNFHPEALASCFLLDTSDVTQYERVSSTKTNNFILDLQMTETACYRNGFSNYVKVDYIDVEIKNSDSVTFSIPKVNEGMQHACGYYIHSWDPEGMSGIYLRRVRANGTLVFDNFSRKVCFVAADNAEIKLQINGSVESFSFRVYYSLNLVAEDEETLRPLYLFSDRLVSTFQTTIPNISTNGSICFLHRTPMVITTMPSVTYDLNNYFYNNSVLSQGITKEAWTEYLNKVNNLYEELNVIGRITNQFFEPASLLCGLFDYFTLNHEINSIIYNPIGGSEYITSIDNQNVLYTVDKRDLMTLSYEYYATAINMLSEIVVKLPEDYNGDITDFIENVYDSVAELYGAFYKQVRNGSYQFITLGNSNLYPNNTLYPSNELKPAGTISIPSNIISNALYSDKDTDKINQIDYTFRDNTGVYSMSCYNWNISGRKQHTLYEQIPVNNIFSIDINFKYNGNIYINSYYSGKLFLIYNDNYEEELTLEDTSQSYNYLTLNFRNTHGKYRNVKKLRFEFNNTYTWSNFTNKVKVWQEEYTTTENINIYKMDSNKLLEFIIPSFNVIKTVIENTLNNIDNISYRTGDFTLLGMPQVESGDLIEIQLDGNAYTIPVLRRVLSGEQLLIDNISIGD